MPLKLVANQSQTLSHTAGSATVTITNSPDNKVKAGGVGVWFQKVSISLSNVLTAIIQNGDGSGSGDIMPTSLKVKDALGNLVLREGDNIVITCTGTTPNTVPPFIPPNIPAVDTVTVTIQNAGQIKAKAQ